MTPEQIARQTAEANLAAARSVGLPMTQAQANAGFVPIFWDGVWALDVTAVVMNAMHNTIDASWNDVRFVTQLPSWFYRQMNHDGPWDIKLEHRWDQTIAPGSFPGGGVVIYMGGHLMTPNRLGNFTYGYIGTAVGFPDRILQFGSWYAAGFPIFGRYARAERADWQDILLGINAWRNR